MRLILYSDGGARGNPGPSGLGFVIFDEDNALVKSDSIYLGHATNNQAEYEALIVGLEFIRKNLVEKYDEIEQISCFLDSELVVKQLNKEYKVKNPEIIILHEKVRKVMFELGTNITFTHIPREKNRLADRLVNEAIDEAIRKGIAR